MERPLRKTRERVTGVHQGSVRGLMVVFQRSVGGLSGVCLGLLVPVSHPLGVCQGSVEGLLGSVGVFMGSVGGHMSHRYWANFST